jgi:hypothetical protein
LAFKRASYDKVQPTTTDNHRQPPTTTDNHRQPPMLLRQLLILLLLALLGCSHGFVRLATNPRQILSQGLLTQNADDPALNLLGGVLNPVPNVLMKSVQKDPEAIAALMSYQLTLVTQMMNDRSKEREQMINDRSKEREQMINDHSKEREQMMDDYSEEREQMINDRSKEREQMINDHSKEREQMMDDYSEKQATFSAKFAKLREQVKARNLLLLKVENKADVRGALEFCRWQMVLSQSEASPSFAYKEAIDSTLKNMLKDPDFKQAFEYACMKSQSRFIDVERCLGGLYHSASKRHHGRAQGTGEVCIDAGEWASNEILCLAVLFDFYNVPYEYYNLDGVRSPLPFTI